MSNSVQNLLIAVVGRHALKKKIDPIKLILKLLDDGSSNVYESDVDNSCHPKKSQDQLRALKFGFNASNNVAEYVMIIYWA